MLERFRHNWSGEICSNTEPLNYQNPFSRTLGAGRTLGPGMAGRLGVASPLISLLTPDTGRTKENVESEKNGLTHFPLALDPLHSNQLFKDHQKVMSR